MRLFVFFCFVLYLAGTLPLAAWAQSEPKANAATRQQTGLLPGIEAVATYPTPTLRRLDKGKWAKLLRDPAFQYQEPGRQAPAASANAWRHFWEKVFSFITSSGGKFLIWIGIALLVVLLVVYILKQNGQLFFSKKDKKTGYNGHPEDEETIPEDWNSYIQEMARSGQYRMALRYGYRYLLELFGARGLLQLQPAKTNYQYMYELSATEWYDPFRQLTQQYEYAWYGGFEVNDQQFYTFYDHLMALQQKLGQH